ncbi:MAG: hypothetical protein IH845_02195 [Nanoarchaeota archaeon]|nr:hypothetical protein [Nanoarchaeota archaeon]
MALYLPSRSHKDYNHSTRPLIFLAGPIQGASRWQNEAIYHFRSSNIDIASPRYIGEDERIIGDWVPNLTPQEQINWETYHLNKAGKTGAILFWLAREDEHSCNRSFAQTSRFELGEWTQKHNTIGAKLVVGIDNCFSGESYIKYRISQDFPNIPITDNLEEACSNVLKLL